MLLNISLFILGFVILYFGAEWLVKGAATIAHSLGIRPVVVGLTVIAFGTSAPEFSVSILSSLKGVTDIAIGNVVGSNVANVGLVLGLAAVLKPFAVDRGSVSRELWMSLAGALLFFVLCFDRTASRLDGFILLAGITAFTTYCIVDEKKRMTAAAGQPVGERQGRAEQEGGGGDDADDSDGLSIPVCILMVAAGLCLLVGGAKLMTDSAVFIARALGVSELAIGLTVVALGTSLPEVAASVVSVFRGEAELAVGNVLGSNIFNLFMVIGGVAVINPMPVAASTVYYQIPIMIGFTVAIIAPLIIFQKVSRLCGFVLLAGYAGFILLSFLAA